MLIRKAFVFTLSLALALGSLTSLGLATTVNAASLQATTGRLVGTVSGPDGVISGATVNIKDNQTGKEYTVTTGSEGTFLVPQLEFGSYTVKVTASGFKTYTASDLKIDAGREYSLSVTLEVGQITETVTVQAGAEVINSSNAEISNTVGKQQIQELPLNGRNPLSLVSLQAGTSNASGVTTINGQRTSFTNITRDGINIQDNFIRSNATDFVPDRPNVDDVSEFTIVTQNAGAELGYGAAQVQLVTPRGSNQYHGAGYIYNRNSEFAANNFFNNANKVKRPFLNRNQFGGSIGGPIIKDKLFFFGAYEGFRLRQSTSSLRTVLLPGVADGNFTYTDNSGVRRTVNVLGLTGLSGDPTVKSRVLDLLPSGNSNEAGDGLNTTGFRLTRAQNQDREAITSRFDWEINQNNSLSVVYNYKKELLLRPDVDAQQGGAAAGFTAIPFGNQDANTPFLAVAYHMLPSSRLSNEIRGGLQFSDPKFDRIDEPSDFFIQVPLVSNPISGFQKQGRNTEIWNIQDNAVWALGQHSFRFGGQAQVFRINPYGPGAFGASTIPTYVLGTNTNTPTLVNSQFTGGISSTQLTTANNLVALLAGIIGSANQTFNVNDKTSGFVPGTLPNRNLNYENYSGYFSDQWRVKPNLTLNLGLRYELFTAIREPNGLLLEPAIGENDPIASILDPNGTYVFVGHNAGGTKIFHADTNNFAPIVSVAWSPNFKNKILSKIFPGDDRTVIRGGYRESYVNDEFVRAADNALTGNAGLSQTISQVNLDARFSAPPTFATPTLQVPRTYVQNNLLAGRFGTVFAVDPNLAVPRLQEYNFSIQRDLGSQTAIELRYVGSHTSSLVRGLDYNQVDIFNNGFADDFNRARQNAILSQAAHNTNPAIPISGAFNPAIPGSQVLTVFPHLTASGLLSNGTVLNNLIGGTPADLAITYVTNNLAGTVRFLPNPSTGVADFLTNSARSNYNAFQAEVRRRFSNGLYLQANYTFSKVLADAAGVGQTNFDPPLNLFGLEMEYSRAPYDQTHVFNLNTIYELPFGKGKPFLNQGGWVDKLVGGFQVTSIIRWNSGPPITITDPRGTFNRAGRSGSQTALTSLNKDQLKGLFGVFKTNCGVFYIDPSVIDFNLDTCTGSGRGAPGFGQPAFPGEVFFNDAPGTTSGLERAFVNGPVFFNWDASLIKDIPIKESVKLELRLEAFNVINRANFNVPQTNINSSTFGRVTSLFGDPRIIQLVGRIQF